MKILCSNVLFFGKTKCSAWAHMVLYLSHAQGGFGVTFNDITKDAAFYTDTSRFVT